MKKLLFISLLFSCEKMEVAPVLGRGIVVDISENKTGGCHYYLDFATPYKSPSVMDFDADCGRYKIGDIVSI